MKKTKHQPSKKSLQPTSANTSQEELAQYFNLGCTLLGQGKQEAAEVVYRQLVTLKPDFAQAHNNLGVVFQQQGKQEEAVKCYQKALSIKPDYVDAYNNLGIAFDKLGDFKAAVENFQHAITLKPDYVNAYRNLGELFRLRRKTEAALQCYQQAFALDPTDVITADILFNMQLHCCDWSTYDSSCEKMVRQVNAGVQGYNPFNFLALPSSMKAQQQCAKGFAQRHMFAKTPLWAGQRYQHTKIRLAYLSADFHNHATAYLMAELFELHDKNRFEIIAISFGARIEDAMRKRLVDSFDRFIEVHSKTDYEVAVLLRELEIDIVIDLKGHTQESRQGIFAYRAAPIQVNYLGYPCTMGTDYMDYILADRHIIPLEHQPYYSEKVVYLPDTYQVNDAKRAIADTIPSRAEVNLPETGFVFCCFNANYKITPAVFACWMRLLTKIEGSVLWLFESNPIAAQNLTEQAQRHNIAATRLIFAPRAQLDQHLARQKRADLFLDTFPCNAHTTASDALWAGLPVLTCMGNTFAGRVAGSLLHAIGLPELITQSLDEYEDLAIQLATSPQLLAQIKAKLQQNRTTYPLFNTDRFRRHLESAYITIWERYQHGELPVSFAVQPIQNS